jgi:cytoskeletal protein CcmA (bactofilin family)
MVQENENQRPRRFSDAVFETVIGAGTSIRGELSGDDAVDLGGRLEGDATLQAHLRVRRGGHLTGAIEARGLVVEGAVEAPRIVADRIEIGASARVKASLQARVVAIAEGAVFDGSVDMQGDETAGGPTYFKEQRQRQ